jgi:geranylgeranyl pyrophosphate synthase
LQAIFEPILTEIPLVEERLKAVAEADFPQLARLLGHVLHREGKRIRPALTLLAGKFHHYNLELLIPMATAIELFHTATLVHDDTIDNSATRRGLPTLSSIWGSEVAVLAGDYLFAKSADLVATTGNLRVITLFAQTLMTICSGQLEENFSTFDPEPSRQQYYQRSGKKTASLFSAAAESGAILSAAPEEAVQALKSYGYNLGLAFQIVDDILDFTAGEEELGKPVAGDLLQGVLTLPAILFMEQHPEDNPIKEMLAERDEEANLKRAIESIRNSAIIGESYGIAQDFSAQACQALQALPDNPPRRALLQLADYVIQRQR